MTRRRLIFALALAGAAGSAMALASAQAVPYCPDLQRVIELAMTKERFASIAGKPRQGNFVETTLALTGWNDCSLYGAATYTCNSPAHKTADEAEYAQARLLDELKACLGEGWSEAKERASPNYVVLHNALRPISITLSTDQNERKEHLVHLILFIRRN